MNLTLAEALRLGPGFGEDVLRAVSRSSNSVSAKREAAASLAPGDWERLDAFAERMASLAVQTSRADLVETGLDALDIALLSDEGKRYLGEYRSLPLLFRACELIGLDPRQTFRNAAPRLRGPLPADVLQFASGRGISVQDAGFEEVRDAEGFRFRVSRGDNEIA